MAPAIRWYSLSDYKKDRKIVPDETPPDRFSDEPYKKGYYAFTSLAYNEKDRRLYCGVTNFSNDILYRFDPDTKRFESLKYAEASFAEKFDIKLHRSVEIDRAGILYGATSCLHDISQRAEGPGGKVFRYDPASRTYRLLSIPKPRDYIQTITLDERRQMIYGFTYPVFEFFAYSMKEDRVLFCEYMESIVHVSELDDRGRYWGTWGGRKHAFFSYDPDTNKVTYHAFGFPEPCRSLMYPNAGPIDCLINGRDGYLYIGTEGAALYRLDPERVELEYLGKPFPGSRLPCLLVGEDGLLYGAGGDADRCLMFTYDRRRRTFATLGKIEDPKSGITCYRTHDMEKIGNTLYVGETDHPYRTNYLWECRI